MLLFYMEADKLERIEKALDDSIDKARFMREEV